MLTYKNAKGETKTIECYNESRSAFLESLFLFRISETLYGGVPLMGMMYIYWVMIWRSQEILLSNVYSIFVMN